MSKCCCTTDFFNPQIGTPLKISTILLGMTLALGATFGFAAEEEAKITEETPYVQSPKVVVDTMLVLM